MTPTIPIEVLEQALQALEGAFNTNPSQPLPPGVRHDIASACGRLEVYVQAILDAQKVTVTRRNDAERVEQ